MFRILGILGLLLSASPASATFLDQGQMNVEVDRSDLRIVAWAASVADAWRGPQDYADLLSPEATHGSPTDVLGDTASAYSLGDGGWLTLELDLPIVDGAGIDFVVFENAFAFGADTFGELMFVEVSSDGTNFARLPAINRIGQATGTWTAIDPSAVYNLAGQFVGGTGLDLADLVRSNHPMVAGGQIDLGAVRYVRVVDVIGDYANASSLDYFGNATSDPYPTVFPSAGADITAVGVLNTVGAVITESQSFGELKSLFR